MISKQYGLSGIGQDVELGKGGPRIRSGSGYVEVITNGGVLAPIRAALPVGDNDVITKGYLETYYDVSVKGEIYDVLGVATFAPSSPTAGMVYLCTTSSGTYVAKRLYRHNGTSFVEIIPPEGMRVVTTDALSSGTDKYLADHEYLWDLDNTAWVDVGPAATESKVNKVLRATFDKDSTSFNIGAAIPNNSRVNKVLVSVVTPFDGSGASLSIGNSTNHSAIADTPEIDLSATGTTSLDAYIKYDTGGQIQGYYSDAGGATAGAAEIEVYYSIA